MGAAGLSVVAIPMNTVQLVGIHEEDRHEEEGENNDDEHNNGENNNVGAGTDKIVLVVTGVPVPNLSVTFVVRF
jgi:microcompartment protein CcmK/EutM